MERYRNILLFAKYSVARAIRTDVTSVVFTSFCAVGNDFKGGGKCYDKTGNLVTFSYSQSVFSGADVRWNI